MKPAFHTQMPGRVLQKKLQEHSSLEDSLRFDRADFNGNDPALIFLGRRLQIGSNLPAPRFVRTADRTGLHRHLRCGRRAAGSAPAL